MIDCRHLEEMNFANEFTAQSRFGQPLEVTAQGRMLEVMPAPELEDHWKTDEQRKLEKNRRERGSTKEVAIGKGFTDARETT